MHLKRVDEAEMCELEALIEIARLHRLTGSLPPANVARVVLYPCTAPIDKALSRLCHQCKQEFRVLSLFRQAQDAGE